MEATIEKELDIATAMLEYARRSGDLNAMAELQYAQIPLLQQKIVKLLSE